MINENNKDKTKLLALIHLYLIMIEEQIIGSVNDNAIKEFKTIFPNLYKNYIDLNSNQPEIYTLKHNNYLDFVLSIPYHYYYIGTYNNEEPLNINLSLIKVIHNNNNKYLPEILFTTQNFSEYFFNKLLKNQYDKYMPQIQDMVKVLFKYHSNLIIPYEKTMKDFKEYL